MRGRRCTEGGEKGHVVDPRQCRIGLRQRRLTADALATPEKVSVPSQVEIEAMAVSAAVVSGPPLWWAVRTWCRYRRRQRSFLAVISRRPRQTRPEERAISATKIFKDVSQP